MSLSNLLIGYRPLVDRDRRIMAMQVRLSGCLEPIASMSALYRLAAGDRPLQSHTLILSAPEAEFDEGLTSLEPMPGLWLEIPVQIAENPEHRSMLLRMHELGLGMVLQGVPNERLHEELLPVFRLSMVEASEDRRMGKGDGVRPGGAGRVRRSIASVQSGVETVEAMELAFASGAYAVCGWLVPDVEASTQEIVRSTDFAGVLKLMEMVDKEADLREIDAVIRQEPELAFRLLKHVDSVGYGLSVPVQNFQHAVMVLGYQGMKRWLSLMLVSVNPDATYRPLMLASFRRGLILEQLLGQSVDAQTREELFLLGVFSLLDRTMGQPFAQLFERVSVPEQVADALIHNQGPYASMLDIVEAIEEGPTYDILPLLDRCHISLEACNRAVLSTLRVASF